MTAADIPRTLGQPDQGFEGNRFTGIPMYDSLTQWDLSKADAASVIIPDLATSWAVDARTRPKWVFKLRPGVKFHDGSAFNADAVVWNVQKVLDKTARHFDASQVGVTASRMPTLRSARKIDELTVEADVLRAGCLPADQPHQPVHRLAGPVGSQVQGGRCGGDRSGRTRQEGVDRLRRRRLGYRPLQDVGLCAARASRAGQERRLLGPQAPAHHRQRW